MGWSSGVSYVASADATETVQDVIGALLADTTELDFTYDDAGNALTIAFKAGGIALAKLAVDPLARANHTGTQTAASVSDFDTQVRTSRLDQMAAPTGSVALNSQKITGLANPSSAQDAMTKATADATYAPVAEPLAVKLATATTKGDLYIATASGTVARHAVPATVGQSIIADSSQTDGWIADYPTSRYDAFSRPSGSIAETIPRLGATIANSAILTSGTLRLTAIMLPANRDVSSITFFSGTTALDTGQNQWFALFDSSRVMVAITADDTSTAWAANSAKTLPIANIASGASATYTTTTAGLYYVGIMVKAGVAVPSLFGITCASFVSTVTPALSGNSNTTQTTPQTFPFTANAPGSSSLTAWAYVS